MFFQREIERYRKTLIKDFSGAEVSAILNQGITDLKNRNIAGAIIVLAGVWLARFDHRLATESSESEALL